MPLVTSDFYPTLPFRNGHFNTMYRPLFMKEKCNYTRERIVTWDADFIDLDFSKVNASTIAILIHGLEGSSASSYMISTANQLNQQHIDTVAFNLRGCSGEDNLLLGTYHSGKTEDVEFVVQHILTHYNYENLILVGFSLGGNLTLKYMGEYAHTLSSKIKGAVAISVPVDIASSEKEMDKVKNKLYIEQFLKTIRLKVLEKSTKFPDFKLDTALLFKAKYFKDLENLYTVPVFGFESPEDYWEKASAKPYLNKINKPTLLINAADDSFLGKKCFPIAEAQDSEYFFLEITKYGGHVGFVSSFKEMEIRWLEKRINTFVRDHILMS